MISKFVEDLRSELSSFKGKSVHDKGSEKKPSKAKDSSAVVAPTAKVTNIVKYDDEDLADATSKVRKQIVNWQQKQSNVHVMQLKEHKDYEFKIERSLNPSSMFKAVVFCNACTKNCSPWCN